MDSRAAAGFGPTFGGQKPSEIVTPLFDSTVTMTVAQQGRDHGRRNLTKCVNFF